jgi:competence protein ComEC
VRAHDLRLLVPAVAAWAAAWCAVGAPDADVPTWLAPAVAWSLGAGAIAMLAGHRLGGARRMPRPGVSASWRGPRWARVGAGRSHADRPGAGRARTTAILAALLVSAACAGVAATQASLQLEARATSPLVEVAGERRTAELTIELTGAPQPARAAPWSVGTTTYRVEARAIALDGIGIPTVPVVVSVQAGDADLAFGSRAVVRARFAPLPAAESAAFRVTASELVDVEPPDPWLAWAAGLRERLSAAASELGGDGGALVPGLAIGDTAAVDEELDAAMKASSLSHLTAVSGANCAIVTAAGFAVAALLGVPRVGRVVAALLALAAFVVLVTPESSVVRAAVMAVVVLVAVASGRAGGGVPALAVAVVVLLAIDPWYARDFGFALSVAATGGLLLLSRPLTRVLARVMPRPLAAVVAVPLAAQLACQPVLLLLDPAIPVYGVPANLLAAPAAPVATVAGLVGCLLLPLLPSVGFAFLQLAWLPANWIAVVARGAAGLPLQRLPWLPDAVGAVTFAGVTALGLWLVLARRGPPVVRNAAAVLLLIAVAVPLGLVAGPSLVGRATRPTDWELAACDVGQGDAVLVREDGATMVIDAGPDPAALARCLDELAVDRVDLAVLTHWDADHVGGSAALAGRVDLVLHGPEDGRRSARVLEPLAASGARTLEVQAGATGSLGFARWSVRWPKPGLAPGNDASVVIDLVTSEYRGVFLGDLGESAQARMLRSSDVGVVDLVKVAHHGSADQSESLYRELDATVGVIGVGADNGYGHPTDRLLDILRATGTTPVRTDRSGLILLDALGDGAFGVWSERDASGVGGRP